MKIFTNPAKDFVEIQILGNMTIIDLLFLFFLGVLENILIVRFLIFFSNHFGIYYTSLQIAI